VTALKLGIAAANLLKCFALEGEFRIERTPPPKTITVAQFTPSRGGIVPMSSVGLVKLSRRLKSTAL
jgi:hypothetical protein